MSTKNMTCFYVPNIGSFLNFKCLLQINNLGFAISLVHFMKTTKINKRCFVVSKLGIAYNQTDRNTNLIVIITM